MARLARLAIADHAHLVLLRGHNGQPVFVDDADRSAFLSVLWSACKAEQVALHAYALLPSQVWLLCTPFASSGLSRAMQSLGRRFALAFNRRHSRSGSLWDGRYRAAVVESGALLLEAMVFVDQADSMNEDLSAPLGPSWSSARQHVGHESTAPLVDPPAYWALGNTPFDRASVYRGLVEEPLRAEQVQRLTAAALRGLAVGSGDFLRALQTLADRPVSARPRGRPRKRVVASA